MGLQTHLYNYSTVSEILESYIKELSESTKFEDNMHANKLRSYKNVINDRQYLRDMRTSLIGLLILLPRIIQN